MKKFLLLSLSFSLCVAASAFDVKPERHTALEMTKASVGRNLAIQRQIVNAADVRPVKALPSVTRSRAAQEVKGLSVNGPARAKGTNVIPATSAIFFESFEDCAHEIDAMPEGWTTESHGSVELDAIDHWLGMSKEYAQYNMFALPAHGNMMAGIFYNDDSYKDEWLISPQVTIPAENYELSFYWYIRPWFFYVIDRYHVDYDEGKFIDREIQCNVEVLVKPTDSSEWKVVYDFEKTFAQFEYDIISEIDYDTMQKAIIDLSEYAGKTIQFAYRYWGQGGDSFKLDAVRVDLPLPAVSFCPDYSRLFFGFSPDEDLWWADASIEFYPVGHELKWYNTSADYDDCDFNWSYCQLNENGKIDWLVDDTAEELSVTYQPDYSSQETLINNFYFLPTLKGRNSKGGISDDVTSSSNFMQVGGTTELPTGNEEAPIMKYVATNFDIINEGFHFHLEEDETLGLLNVPIFGYDVNTDAWWEHHCYPNGKTDPSKYAYVDGFINMYLPHPTAPLVVKGISAAGVGRITPQATFTMKIYNTDAHGAVNDLPLAEKTITGADVITINGGLTNGPYLVMNFDLDEPVIFDSKNTGYAYFVEISGYRDPENVEYFVPLQSVNPNEYEWCFGFYHIYMSGKENDLTNQFSYVCFFKDIWGRDMYTSFAIGLDAHYPWLRLVEDGDQTFTRLGNKVQFFLEGYYDASEYTVSAPEGISVRLKGRYVTEANLVVAAGCTLDEAPITITGPGVNLTVNVPLTDQAGIDTVTTDDADGIADVYNAQGILVKRAATAADVNNLPAGLYIHGAKKILVK